MGSVYSADISEADISLEQQIAIQLRNNHYPPVPLSMVNPCIAAIKMCNMGMWDAMISLPDGVTWKGNIAAPANAIVDAHHLYDWIEEGE